MEHSKRAGELFFSGCNCAQAVACAFAEDMQMDQVQLMRIASSFGGGMGKLREVCGAMSGALMALGALRGYDDPADDAQKAAHYERVREFARRFREENGSILCRELLEGIELKKELPPEPRTPEYYRSRPCARFVESAARIVDEMLAEKVE